MSTRNILLVEDDHLTAETMTATLEAAGYPIVGVARTLDEALALVRRERVDLAVIDVELQGSRSDGVSVALELLQHQEVLLIFVTGHTDSDTLRRIKSTQPAAFLSKPFQPVDLTMQVALALQSSESRSDRATALLPDFLLLPDNGQWVNVGQAEVVFAEANRSLTSVYVFNRRNPFVVSNNLGNIVGQLTLPTFYKLSRSCVVNLHFLAGLKDNQVLLRLSDEPKSPPKAFLIPAEKRAELLRRLPLVKAR